MFCVSRMFRLRRCVYKKHLVARVGPRLITSTQGNTRTRPSDILLRVSPDGNPHGPTLVTWPPPYWHVIQKWRFLRWINELKSWRQGCHGTVCDNVVGALSFYAREAWPHKKNCPPGRLWPVFFPMYRSLCVPLKLSLAPLYLLDYGAGTAAVACVHVCTLAQTSCDYARQNAGQHYFNILVLNA